LFFIQTLIRSFEREIFVNLNFLFWLIGTSPSQVSPIEEIVHLGQITIYWRKNLSFGHTQNSISQASYWAIQEKFLGIQENIFWEFFFPSPSLLHLSCVGSPLSISSHVWLILSLSVFIFLSYYCYCCCCCCWGEFSLLLLIWGSRVWLGGGSQVWSSSRFYLYLLLYFKGLSSERLRWVFIPLEGFPMIQRCVYIFYLDLLLHYICMIWFLKCNLLILR